MEQKKILFKKFLPGTAWFFMVGVLTLMPGKDVPEVSWLEIKNFDKFVHAVLFGGLTLLFCIPYFKAHFTLQQKVNSFIRIALAAIVWGITVEVIQKYFIPGRDFELLDWAADSVGALVALWISIKIQKRFFSSYNKES